MKDYLSKRKNISQLFKLVLMVVMVLIVPFGASGQFVKPTSTGANGAMQYKDAAAAYDRWIADPANAEAKGWKAYGRYIEMNRSRLDTDGNPADPGIFISEAISIQAEKGAMEKLKSGAGWSPVGPITKPPSANGSFSHGMGRINCIAFHPTDPAIYWIGVAQGGVWKTVNGGESYAPLTDNLPILRVSDIAVNPKNPDNIFISVCDYAYIGVALDTDYRKRNTHYGLGVYKTTDGGLTWSETGLKFDQTELDKTLIRRIFYHPTEAGWLLAGGVSGIFKSVDDGATWSQIQTEVIWDIEQDFNNGTILYATTGTVRNSGGNPPKMMKTTDFGATWTTLNTGWPNDLSIGRTEISLTPESSDYIYVIASNPGGSFYGFYRSTDAGSTWEARNTMAANGMNILGGSQGWYDLAILVDPRNKERIFAGGLDMYVSNNGGTSWEQSSFWVMTEDDFTLHADQHQYKYNPVDRKYYACHDGGVARTSDIIAGRGTNGKWATRWEERSNGMIITSFYRIGLCEMFPGYVVGGAQDNSTYYNKNGNWINFIGGDGMDCMINPDDPDIVYGSSQYGSLSRSDNGGGSTRGIRPSGFGSNSCEWTTPIVQDMNNPNFIYTANNNIWKSSNKGNAWTKISNLPTPAGTNKPLKINALALYPKNSSVIYAAQRIHYEYDQPSRMWVTLNGGTTWTDRTSGLPEMLYFTSICVDATDSLTAWVTCGGFSAGQKVFRTKDAGQTWENMSLNLPNLPVNSIVFQENGDNDILYAGTDAGVYYYSGANGTWQLYSNLLPNVIISELEIHEPTKKLFAATFGRGIWMTDLIQGGSGTDPRPFVNSKLSVYPNPASHQFTIDLEGITVTEARLEIISVTGEQMYTELVPVSGTRLNRNLSPGLPAGMYFLRVWAGNNHLTTKIIIN